MRALPLLLLLGCSSTPPADFIEAHGAFADGTAIDVRLPAQSSVATSAQPQLGTLSVLTASASGPGDLRGLRLEWIGSRVDVGAPLPSSPSGPVIFYVARPIPDGGANDSELSVVNGGAVTFTSTARVETGTLANLVLARNGQTVLTIASGSFQATRP